jgi:TetR/AcrR family tetracycline transcriptional repressor
MAMLTASRFTVGSVLEEQSDMGQAPGADRMPDVPQIDHQSAFEAGMALILSGLVQQVERQRCAVRRLV